MTLPRLSIFLIYIPMLFISLITTANAAGDCSPYIGQATLNEFFKDQANQSNDIDDFAEVKILNGSIPISEYGTWKIEICEKSIAANNNDEDGCSGGISLSSFTDTTIPWLVLKSTDIGEHINLKTGFDATLVDGNGDLIDYISVDSYSDAISGFNCNLSNLVFDYTAGSPGASDKTIFRSPDGTGDWDSAPSATAPPTEDTTNDELPPPPTGETYPFVTINNVTVDIGGTAIFTVSLVDTNGDPATFSQTVTISYYTQDGTATVADTDYTEVPLTATPATVSIAAGQTSTSISISSSSSNYADIGQIFYAVLNAVENSVENGDSPNASILEHFGEATLDASGCSFSTTGIFGGAEIDIETNVSFNNGTSTNTLASGTTTTNNSVLLDGSITNQTLTLPALPAITFVNAPDTNLSNGDTLAPGNYDVVSVANNATITLTTGTYNIDQFDIGNNVTIIISGPVVINTNEFKADGDANINTSGDPANLTVNIYNGQDAKFDLGDDSSFTGIVYSSFSNTKIEIDDDNTFIGGIFTTGEVQLKNNSTITYNDAARAAAFSVIGCLPVRIPPTVNTLITPNPTPSITGTYGSTDAAGGFTVAVAGTTYTLGTSPELTAAGDNWTLTIAVPITAGIYDVVASSTNGFSNVITDTTTDELTIGTGICFSDSYPIFAGENLDIKDDNISFTYSGTTTTLTEADTPSSAINTSGITSNQSPPLPALPAITFVTTPDANLTNGNTLTAGDYDVVTIANNASVTLTAGTYNIDQFLLGKGASISVNGPVVINTNEFLYTGGGSGNINVNTGGDPGNFIINLYDGQNGEFDLGNDSSFTGILYSSFSNTKIEIDDDNTLIGAIITNGDIDLKDGSSLTFTAAAKTAAATVIGCSVNNLDHFAINFVSGSTGTGVNCQAESITIEAHDDSHTVFTTHTGSVTLSTSTNNGDWTKTATATDANGTLTLGVADSGSATYNFVTADNGSIILNFKDTNAETTNLNTLNGAISETSGSAIANDDYEIIFASTGFNFLADGVKDAIGIQIGGKRSDIAPGSQTLKLAAVKTNTATGACESAFTGSTPVEIAVECINPTSCTTGDKFYISTDNGTSFDQMDSTPELTYTSVSDFNFGDATVTTAPIIIRYDDVGKIKLHARKTLTPSNEVMSGSSNEFVVRPFAFYPYITNPTNPAATNSLGTVFTTAGTDFMVNVKAVLWQDTDDDSTPANYDGIANGHNDTDPTNNVDLSNNAVANNYGQETTTEQVLLESLLNQPSGGTDPLLDDSSANGQRITSFAVATGIGSSTTINYDEVGIIEIYTKVNDGDYLGIGTTETAKIVGRSGYVGRFTPAYFNVVATEGCTAGATNFTYSAQGFTVNVAAVNSVGATTKNYNGTFVKAPVISNAGTTTEFTNNTFDNTHFSNGIGTRNDVTYTFTNKLTTPLSMTNIRAVDTDSITSETHAEGSNLFRSGRIVIGNAFGSELVDLSIPMRAEYYDGSKFITNTDDVCTTTPLTLALQNPTDTLTTDDGDGTDERSETCIQDTGNPGISGAGCNTASSTSFSNTPSLGIFPLILRQPDSTATFDPDNVIFGSVTIQGTVPSYLQYDWNNNGTHNNNPTGTGTFGLYRGDDRIIYWREVF